MIWIGVIFGLLGLLLTWLKSAGILTLKQKKKLNGIIFRAHEIEARAVDLGCKAGGEEFTDNMQKAEYDESTGSAALPTDPESMRAATISQINAVLRHELLVTGDNRRLLEAHLAYWHQATTAELTKLISLIP
jgi:uncharacterized protein YccT (UPF0319 family)